MSKYQRLYEHLASLGIATQANTYISSPCPKQWIALAHDSAYIDGFIQGTLSQQQMKTIGLQWSEALVKRTLTAVGGTIKTCQLALQFDLSCHLAGGTHHAFADQGRGFCVFNDIAVAVKTLLQQRQLRILVLDCDVHQGDGTALILKDDPSCFTCSIHGADNYPFQKQVSDLDVALPRDTGDADYLVALEQTLLQLEQLPPFDLVIYDAGSDVHRDDRLGQMLLSDDGIRKRDSRVISWAQQRQIPIACLIGGGYDHDHDRLARRHALLIETAERHYRYPAT